LTAKHTNLSDPSLPIASEKDVLVVALGYGVEGYDARSARKIAATDYESLLDFFNKMHGRFWEIPF